MKFQKKEILWNIINSFLAGGLVFLGALTAGKISWESLGAAVLIGLTAAFVQFKNYWDKEKKEYYAPKLFSFIK